MLTQERLKELFHYDKDVGLFTRLIRTSSRTQVGEIAGGIDGNGYIKIKVDNIKYMAHRLAYFYMIGEWPIEIDHINGIKIDNRWNNLRNGTHKQNMQNRRTPNSNNKNNLLGVNYNKKLNKFTSNITINNNRFHLGVFKTIEEAHNAYIKAKRIHHEFNTL